MRHYAIRSAMMYITKDSWLSSGEISLYFVHV